MIGPLVHCPCGGVNVLQEGNVLLCSAAPDNTIWLLNMKYMTYTGEYMHPRPEEIW